MPRDALGIDRPRLRALRARQDAAFRERTPRSQALYRRARELMPHGVPCAWMAGSETPVFVQSGDGASFCDVDGNCYVDMSQCDLSMSCGYGPQPVATAVSRQFRAGSHYLLPTEDAIAVCELLQQRYGALRWQFTLSASGANAEAIRLARLATGRDRTLIFSGKYHGHFDEVMVHDDGRGSMPDALGLPRSVIERTVVVPFNDLGALERALAGGDLACVLTEPAMTNLGVILPEPGFHDALRRLTRQNGALLIIDETHTQVAAYGGLTRRWRLEPDILTLGKSLGGGVPVGAYGVSAPLAKLMEQHLELPLGMPPGLAVGGTTYGSALSLAAIRATLEQVMTPQAFERIAALGARLADGIERVIGARRLPWTAYRLGNRSGICLAPAWPRNAAEASAAIDAELAGAARVFLANHGYWEPLPIHGPTASFVHGTEHIDGYVAALAEFIAAVT